MISWTPECGPYALRTMDARDINLIGRHDDVLPFMGWPPEVEAPDFSAAVSNPENFAFTTRGRDGALLFLRSAPTLYQVHSLALASARGRPMIKLAREALRVLFTASDALEVATQVPDYNKPALGLANLCGFRQVYRREACFRQRYGDMVGLSFRFLRLDDWVARSEAMREMGEVFHGRLEANGVELDHPEDPIHDRWAGFAYAGCLAGNPGKAIGSYNRWASVSGYAPVRLLSVNPTLIDIGSGHIQIADGALHVMKRRS